MQNSDYQTTLLKLKVERYLQKQKPYSENEMLF